MAAKDTAEVKKISPSVLGRLRADYERIRQLKDIGNAEDAVKLRMEQDARMYGITLADLHSQIEALNKPPKQGKRNADIAHRDRGIAATQAVCSFLNEILTTGKTDMKAFNVALKALSKECHDFAEGGIGCMTPIWSPTVDFVELAKGKRVEVNKEGCFCPYVGGWGDGAKNDRFQYAFRKAVTAKSTGYRNDSIIPVVHKTEAKVNKPAKAEKGKAKDKGKKPEAGAEVVAGAEVTQ